MNRWEWIDAASTCEEHHGFWGPYKTPKNQKNTICRSRRLHQRRWRSVRAASRQQWGGVLSGDGGAPVMFAFELTAWATAEHETSRRYRWTESDYLNGLSTTSRLRSEKHFEVGTVQGWNLLKSFEGQNYWTNKHIHIHAKIYEMLIGLDALSIRILLGARRHWLILRVD